MRLGRADVQLLRCPEDVTCEHHLGQEDELCARCHVQLCHRYRPHVFAEDPSQSPAALANDFLVGFASFVIHRQGYLLGAGLRVAMCSELSLVSTRGRNGSGVFNEQAHVQRHRTGARGNITLFPLPLDEVAKE